MSITSFIAALLRPQPHVGCACHSRLNYRPPSQDAKAPAGSAGRPPRPEDEEKE